MHAKSKVIAVLIAEDDAHLEQPATMLVRDASGQISLQMIDHRSSVATNAWLRDGEVPQFSS